MHVGGMGGQDAQLGIFYIRAQPLGSAQLMGMGMQSGIAGNKWSYIVILCQPYM